MLKIKAGTLQISMYVIVVVALLLSGFILFVHTHKLMALKVGLTKQVVKDAQFGMHYALKHSIISQDTLDIAKEQYKEGSLKIHANYWGVFEKCISISKIKNHQFDKIGLLGGKQDLSNRTALYLKDRNKPLVLVGNALVSGTTYLPKQGVRTGNISGHSFYGNRPINGRVFTSKSNLPRWPSKLVDNIKNIAFDISTLKMEQFLDIKSHEICTNSFKAPVKVVYGNNTLELANVSLLGNIIVQSRSKIIVYPSTRLKDVILVAPEIEIKSGTNGSFQAFATKGILIEGGCNLAYPSAIVLRERSNKILGDNKQKSPSISINKGCNISGIIAYMGTTTNYQSQVFIDESTTINGEVYCNQNLELLGTVNGSVFTSGFVANQSGSSYQNHLYNGKIILSNLPEVYSGLLFENKEKSVVKWLY